MADQLQKELQEKTRRINQALEHFIDNIPNPVPNLHEGLRYGLGLDQASSLQQGKRIRPALALEACESLGGDPQDAMPLAMAIELMHNFFLVHDDIEDGDAYRRGRPAIWKHFGLAHGVNIGDFFFTQVFAAFLSQRNRPYSPDLSLQLLHLLVDTLERTHIGQALDIEARRRRDLQLDDYMEIVTNKTGYYLAAPIIGGA
ncbi:MAG: polyprenyl synthetase family protein, partial [Candidatus Sumerlaeota bacterium]